MSVTAFVADSIISVPTETQMILRPDGTVNWLHGNDNNNIRLRRHPASLAHQEYQWSNDWMFSVTAAHLATFRLAELPVVLDVSTQSHAAEFDRQRTIS